MGDSIRDVREKGLVEGNSEWTEQGGGGHLLRVWGPNCLPTFQNIPQLSPWLPAWVPAHKILVLSTAAAPR